MNDFNLDFISIHQKKVKKVLEIAFANASSLKFRDFTDKLAAIT